MSRRIAALMVIGMTSRIVSAYAQEQSPALGPSRSPTCQRVRHSSSVKVIRRFGNTDSHGGHVATHSCVGIEGEPRR